MRNAAVLRERVIAHEPDKKLNLAGLLGRCTELVELALLLFIDHPWPNVNEKTTPGTGKSCPPNFQSARHIRDAAGWLNSCDRTAQGHAIRGERQYRRRIAFRAKQ